MRCPSCDHNQKYRSGMVCARCRYRFLLDPKRPPYVADRRFVHAIEAASRSGERAYTPRQLHATMFRKRNRGWFRRVFLASGTGNVAATEDAVDRWAAAQRPLGPIVTRPTLDVPDAEPGWPEPDLFDYGAEGILVVDDWYLVDLLVALGLHTAARVVVVDVHGYPRPVTERARAAVAVRPDLPVFVLHATVPYQDRAPEAVSSARTLLGAADNPLVDLGLRNDAPKRLDPLRWTRRLGTVTPDMLPHRWLTSGLAAAIAHRVSLDELVHPPAEQGADDGGATYPLWSADGNDDGDGDFG